jgi:uncharacterized protein (DUF488 family)
VLDRYGLRAVADVRRFPGSRRQPQFAGSTLADALAARGITYRWLPELGGRRRPVPDSPNTRWRNASFRGYADHMSTPEFAAGLEQLLDLAADARTVMMCAEAVWWRCHRALVADALRVRGNEVVHVLDAEHATAHPYTSPARIVGGRLTYEPDEPEAR